MNEEANNYSRRILRECSGNGISRIRSRAIRQGSFRPQGHDWDSVDSAIVRDSSDIMTHVPGDSDFTDAAIINLLEEGIVQHDSLQGGVLSYNNREDTSEEFQKLRIKGNLLHQSENKLPIALDEYRRVAIFTDCEIRVGEKVFYIHKCILASLSKVFHRLFMEKPTASCVQIPHVTSTAFALLLDYVYLGCLDFQAKTMVDFLDVLDGAIYLGFPEVAEFCLKIFNENLSHSTAVDLLNAACRHKLVPARSAAVKFMQDNAAFMIERPRDLERVHPNVLTDDLKIHMAHFVVDITAAMIEWLRQFCNIHGLALLSGHRRSDGGILDVIYTGALSTENIKEPFQNFDPPKPIPEPKFAAGVASIAGKIILAGGSSDDHNATKSVHSLDIQTLKWNKEAYMSTARSFFTLTPLLWNGWQAVVAHGGKNNNRSNLDTAELLAVDTMNCWTSCPKLPCALYAHAAAVVDDQSKIYITGGNPGSRKTTFSWQPEETKWKKVADMKEARADHCMCYLNRALYVFGGDSTHIKAEKYDLETDQWTVIPNLPEPGKYYATCTVVLDWVVLIGGEDDQILIFDSRHKSWRKSAQKLPWKKLTWPSCCVLTKQPLAISSLPKATSLFPDKKQVTQARDVKRHSSVQTNDLGHARNCRCLNCQFSQKGLSDSLQKKADGRH